MSTMDGYAANPQAASAVAGEMQKRAAALRAVNQELNDAANKSMQNWEASARNAWTALQTKLTNSADALANNGIQAGSSMNDIMNAIQTTDKNIASLF